jgi:hypothetical protein
MRQACKAASDFLGSTAHQELGGRPTPTCPPGQGGAPAGEDVAGPATKRVNATASILPDARRVDMADGVLSSLGNPGHNPSRPVGGGPNRAIPLFGQGLG